MDVVVVGWPGNSPENADAPTCKSNDENKNHNALDKNTNYYTLRNVQSREIARNQMLHGSRECAPHVSRAQGASVDG